GGACKAGGELPDAAAQLVKGGVEAGRVAGRDGVGDRPVQCRELAEFFVGHVADGDDQVAVLLHAADVPGPAPGQRELVPLRGVEGAGVDGAGGTGAGGGDGEAASLPP